MGGGTGTGSVLPHSRVAISELLVPCSWAQRLQGWPGKGSGKSWNPLASQLLGQQS